VFTPLPSNRSSSLNGICRSPSLKRMVNHAELSSLPSGKWGEGEGEGEGEGDGEGAGKGEGEGKRTEHAT
jgi:hypothetical protein